MKTIALSPGPYELVDRALAFWRWWTGELVECIPSRWRERLVGPRPRIEIAFGDDRVVASRLEKNQCTELANLERGEVVTAPQIQAPDDVDTTILLPQEQVLRRRVALPDAALPNLRAILGHEIARLSPLDPSQILWTHEVRNRDRIKRQIVVEVGIVKRNTIDEALAASHALGLTPSRAQSGAGDEAAVFPLPRDRTINPRILWRRHGTKLLGAAVVLLLVVNVFQDYRHQTKTTQALAAELHRLKPDVERVEALHAKMTSLRQSITGLTAKANHPLLLTSLAEMTRLLPGDTWVFDYRTEKDETTIRGYAGNAANLIAAIDRSKLFHDAQFEAPLTKSATEGKDRFDLSAKIKGGS